ncbi:hypothetical protein NVS55_09330 [Myxococcus stipitatus]|uniref:hypothetical protein n=1 Tax=Myxococcus stipitatus TaxID=83455 RepID=UPI0031452043
MIHIVVRHPRDVQTWKNQWRSEQDSRMEWISTDAEVARHCQTARDTGVRVRFHRCGFQPFAPVVCCDARVKDVQKVSRDFYIVHFEDQVAMNLEPMHKPHQRQNWYRAGP